MQVKWTAIVAEAVGHLGGTVFYYSPRGGIARTKVTPINPSTSYQVEQRAIFRYLAQYWDDLTDPQRAGWVQFGKDHPIIDPFGSPRPLAGNAAFIRSNISILRNGDSQVNDPPENMDSTPVIIGEDTNIELVDLNLYFAPDCLPDERLIIELTPRVSPGIGNPENKLVEVWATALGAGPTATWTITDPRVGTYVNGDKAWIRIRRYNRTNGALSVAATKQITVIG